MPVLRQTDYIARITWLGQAPAGEGLRSRPADQLEIGFDGLAGARHQGGTAPSCSRVKNLHPRGTEIRNSRQLSLLSAEELAQIAARMELGALDPALVGANIVLGGIPDFSRVPPGARLQAPDGATLTVNLENRPCVLPAREIEAEHPGFGARFKPAAEHRRGITAWVERPGCLRLGQSLGLFVPDQPAWAP
ncbi:MOSC domain-containing protein [Cribrihabitans neustonicus]|uniref:MOSC domain-containing protein n=1 Tax=Cribrihabitans neustonicus TaxID=1429085 RepID=UPI003B5986BC